MSDRTRLHKYGPEFPQRGPELRDQAETGAACVRATIFGAVQPTKPIFEGPRTVVRQVCFLHLRVSHMLCMSSLLSSVKSILGKISLRGKTKSRDVSKRECALKPALFNFQRDFPSAKLVKYVVLQGVSNLFHCL